MMSNKFLPTGIQDLNYMIGKLRLTVLLVGICLFVNIPQLRAEADKNPFAPIAVSENGKHLIKSNGDPFLWIGDTAWNMHHRLTKEEITNYLEDRKRKGFTVILFKIPLSENSGAGNGNRYGHFPFRNKDISKPNEKFFELVDFSLEEMERLELVAGFLPLWGWVVGNKFGYSTTDEDIAFYANWVGNRYKDRKNIVWISGGDTGNSAKWATLGRGLKAADPEKLVTFHPGRKGISSFHMFGDARWIDFHMTQTGHTENLATNYLTVNEVYLKSSKPIVNGEPAYEGIRIGDDKRISPHQVRKAAYWSLFAGGFGHVYGHVNIFQFARAIKGQIDTWGAYKNWQESLNDPGTMQLSYLAAFVDRLEWSRFRPNQNLILSSNPAGPAHMRASMSMGSTIGVIYFPEKRQAKIDLSAVKDISYAWWFNPQSGTYQEISLPSSSGVWTVTSPYSQDAVLILAAGKFIASPELPPRVEEGLLALYDFEEGNGDIIHDVSEIGQPLDLVISDESAVNWVENGIQIAEPALISSKSTAGKITEVIRNSNEFSIELWLRPASPDQRGPARIVSISDSPRARNVTLSQGLWGGLPGNLYDLRLRTTANSLNGTPSFSTPERVIKTKLTHIIFTRDQLGNSRYYLNGELVAEAVIPGDLSNWEAGYPLMLANESQGNYPWLGDFYLLAIYDEAIGFDGVQKLFRAGP